MLAELEDLPSQFIGLVIDGLCSREAFGDEADLGDDAGFAMSMGTMGSCGMGREMVGGVREPTLRELR